MSNSYPTSPRAAFLTWCQAHTEIFTTSFAAIGLTSAQALDFATATSTAAAAQLTGEEAKQAQKSATQQTDSAFLDLRRVAGDTVRLIRTFADMQTDPDAVYAIANVPPPQPKSPQAPPDQPYDIKGLLDTSTGALTISWKAANPGTGTSYIVKRRLETEASFEYIGTTGSKSFVDGTLPLGVERAFYTIQGQRADSTGPVSAIFTATFGRVGEAASEGSTPIKQPKLAA